MPGDSPPRTLEEQNRALHTLDHKWGRADVWMQKLGETVQFNAGSLNNVLAKQHMMEEQMAAMKKIIGENGAEFKKKVEQHMLHMKHATQRTRSSSSLLRRCTPRK